MEDLFGFDEEKQKYQYVQPITEPNAEPLPSPIPSAGLDKKLKFKLWWLSKFLYKPEKSNSLLSWWNTVMNAPHAVIGVLGFMTVLALTMHYDRFSGIETRNYLYAGMAGFIISAVFTVITALFFIKKTPYQNAAKIKSLKKQAKNYLLSGIVFSSIFPVLLTVLGIIDISVGKQGLIKYIFKYSLYTSGTAIYITVLGIVYLVLGIITLTFYKKVCKIIETDEELINGAAAASLYAAKAKNEAYDRKRNAQREAAGKVAKTAREYEKERTIKKVLHIGEFVVLPVLVLAVIFFSFAFGGGTFNSKTIERINVGDEMNYVQRILGDPYDRRDYSDPLHGVKGGSWLYCSSALAKQISVKNKQLEKLTENADDMDEDTLEKMINLSEEIMNLEIKLAETAADYITITYEGNGVTDIRFYKNCKGEPTGDEKISKITYGLIEDIHGRLTAWEYGSDIVLKNYKKDIFESEIIVRTYFTNGNMESKKIKIKADFSQADLQKVIWRDGYGEHSLQIRRLP